MTDSRKHDDDDDINDLQRLAQLKLSGHRREHPQSQSKAQTPPEVQGDPIRFTCTKCDFDQESLEDHIDNHIEGGDFAWDSCLLQSKRLKLLKIIF